MQAHYPMGAEPVAAFMAAELLRVGAASEHDGVLLARAPGGG